jgi:hypothetical protein
MTDEEFDALLGDPAFPWDYRSGSDGGRAVAVAALLAFARERCPSADERELDRHVDRHDGTKETEVWDLADVPRNALRALLRRPRKQAPAVYLMP